MLDPSTPPSSPLDSRLHTPSYSPRSSDSLDSTTGVRASRPLTKLEPVSNHGDMAGPEDDYRAKSARKNLRMDVGSIHCAFRSLYSKPRWLGLVVVVAFFVFTQNSSTSPIHPHVEQEVRQAVTQHRAPTRPVPKNRACSFDLAEDPLPVYEITSQINYANHPVSIHRPSNQFYDCSPDVLTQSPVLTIITSTKDPQENFDLTIKSILQQSLRNFRWLIIDDHSEDATSLARIQRAADADPRISLRRNTGPGGLVGARNFALQIIRTEPEFFTPYVGMFDDDDLIELTMLEKSVWMLESNPQWSIASHYWVKFGAQNVTEIHGLHSGPANYFSQNYISNAAIIRRKPMLSCDYDPDFSVGGEDWDFWLCLAENGHWGGTLPELAYWYRVNTQAFRSARWNGSFEDSGPLRLREHVQHKHQHFQLDPSSFPPYLLPKSVELEPVDWNPPFINAIAETSRKGSILVWLPWLYVGGADIGALRQIEMLTRAGYRVTVVCTLFKPPEGIELRPLVMQWTHDVHVLPSFLRARDFPRYIKYIIQSREIQTVLISNAMLAYEILPALREQLPDVTFLDYLHNEAYDGWKSGGYPTYSIIHQRYLDRTITCSHHLRQWMIQRGYDETRIGVVKLGVDTERIRPPAGDYERKSMKERLYRTPKDVTVILSVARLDPQKRPLLLPHIINKLVMEHGYSCGRDRRRKRSILMVMVGAGQLESQLRELITEMDLDACFFLAGTQADASVYFKSADLFLLPSMSEGISVAVSEAMAAGLPLVVASAGALPEQVGLEDEPDRAGVLVEQRLDIKVDSQIYARAVTDLLSDSGLMSKLGQNGLKRVQMSDWHATLQGMFAELKLATEARQTERSPAELATLPHPAAQLALQTQLHEYRSLFDISLTQRTLMNVKPRHGYGKELQMMCGEIPSTTPWIDAVENPNACSPSTRIDVHGLQRSAVHQCDYWCIWDLRTPKRAGWMFNGECFKPLTGSMCQESFNLRPRQMIAG